MLSFNTTGVFNKKLIKPFKNQIKYHYSYSLHEKRKKITTIHEYDKKSIRFIADNIDFTYLHCHLRAVYVYP